jgi:hypothetical protein
VSEVNDGKQELMNTHARYKWLNINEGIADNEILRHDNKAFFYLGRRLEKLNINDLIKLKF